MNKRIYIIGIVALLQLTCKKTEDDFKGTEKLAGRLSYRDIYSGDGIAKPLAKKIVRLAYSPSDTLNYLYSDSTDADGYFLFENVEKGRSYDLFYTDSIGGIRYNAFTTVVPPNTTISLVAGNDSTGQNGLYAETKLNGQLIGGVRICIFNNQTQFNADTCNGSYRSDVSDNSGRKIFYNLLPGSYYIKAYKKMGPDFYLASTTLPVVIGRLGIPRINFNLEKVVPVNTLAVHVQDLSLLPVSGITVGIYTNRAAYVADTTITAAYKTGPTEPDGNINFNDINPGKYYVRARMVISNVRIAGSDSTTVTATGIAPVTVTIK